MLPCPSVCVGVGKRDYGQRKIQFSSVHNHAGYRVFKLKQMTFVIQTHTQTHTDGYPAPGNLILRGDDENIAKQLQ